MVFYFFAKSEAIQKELNVWTMVWFWFGCGSCVQVLVNGLRKVRLTALSSITLTIPDLTSRKYSKDRKHS